MALDLSESAATELRHLLKERQASPDTGLRLVIQKGGCAGMQYAMKLDTPGKDDTVVKRDGVQLIVDSASLQFVDGSVVDFSDALTDSGFKITNPKASRACGCGSSFEPAESSQQNPLPPKSDAEAMPCAGDDDPQPT